MQSIYVIAIIFLLIASHRHHAYLLIYFCVHLEFDCPWFVWQIGPAMGVDLFSHTTPSLVNVLAVYAIKYTFIVVIAINT